MARTPSNISIEILRILHESHLHAEDLCDFILSGGYPYKFGGSKEKAGAFYKRTRERRWEVDEIISKAELRQKLHNALYRLKKDGLIDAEKTGRRSIFKTTKLGIGRMKTWQSTRGKNTERYAQAMPQARYEKTKAPHAIIVSFDIPEKESIKRRWLRSALKNLDFEMLHQSTWIGKNVLPKELISEIHRLEIDRHVKIFSVVKRGTID